MNARAVLSILVAASILSLPASVAGASDPATSELLVSSTPGEPVEVSYTGTVQPGASAAATNECATVHGPDADDHVTAITVPDGLYSSGALQVQFVFDITWDDDVQDLALSVVDSAGDVVGSSDGGSPQETVGVTNLPSGEYTVIACGFAAAAPTPYAATITAQTQAFEPLPAPEDDLGLAFSAATVADIQRDEAEPLITIDGDGNAYTCGPTGSSQVNEYAQVSTDGGDQFNLLGEQPRGQISEGGGGDCALDTALEYNANGVFQLAYTGLSSLTTFTTATSDDLGQTIQASPTSQSVPVVDRQWVTFTDDLTVFHAYNKLLLGVHVQRSDDGGLSYGTDALISPGAARGPGDITGMPASLNPAGDVPAVYYPWQRGNAVMMAVSLDNGTTWNNCTITAAPINPGRLFPILDHDVEGNLYAGWTDEADDDTYMAVLRNEDIPKCNGGIDGPEAFDVNPGFSDPFKVNRAPVNSTVFPWLVAGGAPGRVAMAYFGTTDLEKPDVANSKTWNVYVAQTLNALDALDGDPVRFSQVPVTTHPPHYDSICLNGLGCNTSVPEGDRSMADFFAMDLNPVNGELMVVFNRTHKKPGDAAGLVATPVVVRQVAGPSNLGGTISVPDRVALRNESDDPTGDALAHYSAQSITPTRTNIDAADITHIEVGAPIDPSSGDAVADGGFTVTATFADLSDAALQQALTDAGGQSLMYIFRFVDGYQFSAAVAWWNPIEGWNFGFNGFAGAPSECPASDLAGPAGEDGCLKYPADQPLDLAAVDVETGTLTMTVPLSYLSALEPGDAVPTEVPAEMGDRIYTSSMFTQVNPVSVTPAVHAWLIPLDNSPAFDFILGSGATDPGQPDAGTGGDGATDDASDDGPPTPMTGAGLGAAALVAALAAVAMRRQRVKA